MRFNNLKYIVLTIIMLLASISFIRTTIDIMRSKGRLEVLQAEVAGLQIEKAQIQNELDYSRSPEYIEQEARNKLNMVKENEKIYVVAGELNGNIVGNTISQEDASGDMSRSELQNARMWLDLLF